MMLPQSSAFGPREAEPAGSPVLKGPDATQSENKRWVRTGEAAKRIQHSVSALVSWRFHGLGPAYSKLGRAVLYDVTDLDAWVEAQRIETRVPSKREAA